MRSHVASVSTPKRGNFSGDVSSLRGPPHPVRGVTPNAFVALPKWQRFYLSLSLGAGLALSSTCG